LNVFDKQLVFGAHGDPRISFLRAPLVSEPLSSDTSQTSKNRGQADASVLSCSDGTTIRNEVPDRLLIRRSRAAANTTVY
jgi:hypothetical protein